MMPAVVQLLLGADPRRQPTVLLPQAATHARNAVVIATAMGEALEIGRMPVASLVSEAAGRRLPRPARSPTRVVTGWHR
jgi:thiazole synthase ThiGH ThiG subunit